jgi:hypothetical protein
MGSRAGIDGWPKATAPGAGLAVPAQPCRSAVLLSRARSAVPAQHGRHQQQHAHRHGPLRQAVRLTADALHRSARWSAPSSRSRARRRSLRGNPAALDALTHLCLFDFGPPRAGLGSHCHRSEANNASGGKFRLWRCLREGLCELCGKRPASYSVNVERAAQCPGRVGCSVPGHGGDVVGDGFGISALVEQRRHLTQAACPPFGDGIQHQRLASRFRGDLAA